METIKKKLEGHYNYYGVSDNYRSICSFYYVINGLTYKWLNKRSQRKSFTWNKYSKLIKLFRIPTPKIKVNIYTI